MTYSTGRAVVYLDNAATSRPKPDCVLAAMAECLRDVGASPGRSGHRLANQAERVRFETRQLLAELFGVSDPLRVIFALNATSALNLVIGGLLPPGTHVVTTSMEHNSVMRPIRAAELRGASVSVVRCQPAGGLNADAIEEHLRPETRLIVVNHASNVCGTVLPVREIGAIARRRGIPFLVDAAQTAGVLPINLATDNIDLLAFSGHKGLLGPSGTGGLIFGDGFDVSALPPMVYGGTGSGSEHETQPDFLPDKYESGTPNLVGIAGLNAGIRYLLDRGAERVRAREQELAQRLIDGLAAIPRTRVIGTSAAPKPAATVSCAVEGMVASEVAQALDQRFDVMCRPGLHCAPSAHRTLGTFPEGTIRLAPGLFTTDAEVEHALDAMSAVVAS